MQGTIDKDTLHRTAKYFMDSGRAATHEDAKALLDGFGLTVFAGEEVAHSPQHQLALLTLVNAARRTLLGGIEVVGLSDTPSLIAIAGVRSLRQVVCELGGRPVEEERAGWPYAVVGTVSNRASDMPGWRLTWEGWRAGVMPTREDRRMGEDATVALSPVLAAAVCAAEAFAWHAGDHPMAGRRTAGLSLWRPGACWLEADADESALAYLPSRLWLIGLGNLGQAYAWLLACLPYRDRSKVQIVLQDYDRIAISNDSTSILSFVKDRNRRKTRVVGEWLESAGFDTFLEERKFGKWTQRTSDEPGVALCGVDNPIARAALEDAGFGLVVEAGLGAGPQGFRNLSMHSFPSSRKAAAIWQQQSEAPAASVEGMPAYQDLRKAGMDGCGLAQLASRTVGVPFVGLIAGCLVVSELLRRLHGGTALELAALSATALEDIETMPMESGLYEFGHLLA